MSVIFVVNLYFLICCIFSLYLTHQLISSSDLHIRLTELKLKLIHLSSLFVKPSARGKLAVTVSADLRRHSDPHTKCLQEELEKVQNRAARFVTRNYTFEEGSMTGILEQLRWESLKKRRTDNRLILLYKGLKGKARIPTDDLIPKTRRCRNSHSKAFQLPSASIEAYKCSFFPQTIRDWNDLPDSLFSTAEMSDDCVSKFASLVRSRD